MISGSSYDPAIIVIENVSEINSILTKIVINLFFISFTSQIPIYIIRISLLINFSQYIGNLCFNNIVLLYVPLKENLKIECND